jgi:hypothetical protein
VRPVVGLLAALALASAAAATPPGMQSGFETPSHNIACEADLTAANTHVLHCVVFSASGKRGQKTWSMKTTGRASVGFFMANIATETPVLRYGRTWRWHGIDCRSAVTGLTCKNVAGHGWFLSRERQRIF